MPANEFELSEVMEYVGKQLKYAHEAAVQRGEAVMTFDECEVEFSVKLEASADAKVKVWVVEMGAGGKVEHSNRIKLKYKSIGGITANVDAAAPAPPTPRQSARKRTK